MCLTQSNIRGLAKWNWDGDVIVHGPVVPSSRPAVGYTRNHEYDIDVREFLATEHNALIQKTLREDVAEYVRKLPGGDPVLFQSKESNSFDYRAFVVTLGRLRTRRLQVQKGKRPVAVPG